MPMTLVRMKEKGQVTIPAAVREALSAKRGDVFEVAVSDGNIVLKPQIVVAKKGVDIGPWIGAGKGLFATPEEVDAFIAAERARWE